MFLAAILAMCLLPRPHARVPFFCVAAGLRSTQAQDQPSNASPQGLPAQPPNNQQEVQKQSAAPQAPPVASAPCPEKSQPGSTTRPDCKPTESTGAKPRKPHRTHKKVAPAEMQAGASPTKTVVRNGSTRDPALDLSTGLSQKQASDQQEITKQLMAKSVADLKRISQRQLSADQQDTVQQIKSYLEQANKATQDQDWQRAHNLAVKANLLSVELAGH